MKFLKGGLSLCVALLLICICRAQTNTYILNGSAVQNSCNCYTLTPPVNTISGSVWNANKINLNQPFDFVFNVYLGCADANGADGIVFMLQPISTSIGTTGEGMGFEGISPSIGISLDTWQNSNRNDPVYDHIGIQANGMVTHNNDLAGPVQASATNPNIEDCQWHTFRVKWDPASKILSTYFDGDFRLQTNTDLINTIFNNDPLVYWGFSAGTGGANNLQQFCTALNPSFITNAINNSICIGNSISFTNTSQSFAPIASYYWDFGDGITSNLQTPPPHVYTTVGSYEVRLAITGLDGCNSDTMKQIIKVGDPPVANFQVYDTCEGFPPRIREISTVQFGTIAQWNWKLDGAPVSTAQNPQINDLPRGPHQLELTVGSNYGCLSAPITHNFIIKSRPYIEGSAANGCVNKPVQFQATQIDNATSIINWQWDFGDNQTGTTQNPTHVYSGPGSYIATLTAIGSDGCPSAKFEIPIFINKAIAFAGNDTVVLNGVPFQLNGTGGISYSWSPSVDLSNPGIQNPIAILFDDRKYTLIVTTAEGCIASDEINITVFKGSTIFTPGGFTPNQDGLNDRIKPYYIGIKKLEYFSIFNRWGELVFTTKDLSAGWNGIFKGSAQPSGTYVWMLKAIDYAGKVYQLKGSTTLIR